MSFKITWKTHLICLILAIVLVYAMGSVVGIILNSFFSSKIILYLTKNYVINFYVNIVFLMIPITIVHEIIHGIAYKIFGRKVKYGFKVIYAYTAETSGEPMGRTKFLIVLLAPVIVISILSVILPVWLGGMVYFLNLLGSIGDLYMAFALCRYRYDSKIIDREYGFDVINF